MLHNPHTVFELARQRESELVREAEMRRLAGPGRISRALRRLVAGGAMHRDRDTPLSRTGSWRVMP